MTGTAAFTLFDARETNRLERGDLTRLAAGILASIRVPEFFSPDECSAIMDGLDRCEMGSYDEDLVEPRIAKLGPAAYDFYSSGELEDRYWTAAENAAKTRLGLLPDADVMDLALARLGAAWCGPVRYAQSGGRDMFGGMIREINDGARLHFDEIVREMAGTLDEVPIAQLAFNCHLSTFAFGGESVVHRRRWKPADEDHRSGYGYDLALVAGEPTVQVRAEVGDAVFFDPRNYHLVRPGSGPGRRATLSFFVGITGNGELIIWS